VPWRKTVGRLTVREGLGHLPLREQSAARIYE
jgi:hypothetical protein